MTREEASNVLWWASKQHYPGDQMDITEYIIEAFDMAIAALRGSEPDPDTGLVPCGCGGKAVFDSAYGDDEVESSYTAEVHCELCEIRTPIFRENADVKAAWNRAMGWKGGAE